MLEQPIEGEAGSVLIMDSRLWHAIPPNNAPSKEPRVAVAVRYSPWWMDSSTLLLDSRTRQRMAVAWGQDAESDAPLAEPVQPPTPVEAFRKLPLELQPLVAHTVVNKEGGVNRVVSNGASEQAKTSRL